MKKALTLLGIIIALTASATIFFAIAVSFAETPRHFSKSRTGMVASGSTYATAAGVTLLEQGGNAIDAAAATAFAIMVTDPANASIGGRVQALIRMKDGAVTGIDGATQVPRDFRPPRDKAEKREGWAIVPVPGGPAALEEMVRRYGRKSLSDVLQPAIKLAEEGFVVPPRLGRTWAAHQDELSKDPGAKQHFLKPDGTAYKAGETFRRPRLAAVLREIAAKGTVVLYRGAIAETIARDAAANGSSLRSADLAEYRVQPGRLARTQYHGHEVVTGGARSWGSPLHEMLKTLNGATIGPGEPTAGEVETIARAIAKALANQPRESAVRPAKTADQPHDTTHMSVMDAAGNAVALTTSIGPSFGSHVASPSLGFLYAHSYRMESDGAPGERDMSELAPSIVLREGKPILVIGGAGRERIPSAVLQVMINVIDRQMTLERAVLSPRVFLTKDTLRIHDAFLPEVMQPLSERFSIEKVELGAALHLGLVHAVRYDPETREFFGAADLGDSGSAMAPAGSEQRKR